MGNLIVGLVVVIAAVPVLAHLIQLRRDVDALKARLGRLERRRSRQAATGAPESSGEQSVQKPEEAVARDPESPPAELAEQPPSDRPRPRRSRSEALAPGEDETSPEQTPERSVGWEERIGAQWSVWIGAIAITMAGVFLVRYFAEQGLLGPRVRTAGAGVLGLVLIGLGEWLRTRLERIAQGLVASGIGVLFASLVAAVSLHHFIGSRPGLLLTGLVTAGAVLLSLRHGLPVAVLGLVGGFAMPALIGAHDVPTSQLFAYLLALEVGSIVLVRIQGWAWLLIPTALAALIWPGYWLALQYDPAESPWLGLYLSGSILVLFGASIGASIESMERRRASELTSWLAAIGGLVQMGVLVEASSFSTNDWGLVGCLGAASLLLGRVRIRYRALAALAATTSVVLLATWGLLESSELEARYLQVAGSLGALFAVGASLCAIRHSQPGGWIWLAWGSAFAHCVVAYLFGRALWEGDWWVLPAGLAATCALGTWLAARGGFRAEPGRDPTMAWSIGAVAFFAMAVWFGWARHERSIAWSLAVPLLLFVDVRWGLRWLRSAAVVLAGLAVASLFRPDVLQYPVTEAWLSSWWLWGYGVPTALLLLSARACESRGLETSSQWLTSFGLLSGIAGASIALRFAWHGPELWSEPWRSVERATWSLFLGILAALLFRLDRRRPRPTARGFAVVLTVVVLLTSVLAGLASPLVTGEKVGELPLVNDLLLIHGAPAVLLIFLAQAAARAEMPGLARVSRITSIGLLFILVTLEVRQAFHGSELAWRGERIASSESYAYSAAWMLLGLVLLGLGLWRRGRTLRVASLVVLLAAIFKVFLIDMSHLEDLWRVASFLGLGCLLLLVAWLYQRFVFGLSRGR